MMLQLVGLERSTKAGGQDRIDHPRHGHDDIANGCCRGFGLRLQQLDIFGAAELQGQREDGCDL
jgi:hypothetical protein